MKTLRIMSLALVLVLALGFCASCGAIAKNKLVGTWENDLVSYTFEKDGTGKYKALGISVDMTYKIDGEELWVTRKVLGVSVDESYTYKFMDDQLKLTSSDGTEVILTKK